MIVVGVPLFVWLSMRSDLNFRHELSAREPLDDSKFYSTFYGNTDIPEHITSRLRPIYAGYFQLDAEKLRPSDRPPDIVDFDTAPLVDAIESEFGVTISDEVAENIDGSFDSIVQFLAAAA